MYVGVACCGGYMAGIAGIEDHGSVRLGCTCNMERYTRFFP